MNCEWYSVLFASFISPLSLKSHPYSPIFSRMHPWDITCSTYNVYIHLSLNTFWIFSVVFPLTFRVSRGRLTPYLSHIICPVGWHQLQRSGVEWWEGIPQLISQALKVNLTNCLMMLLYYLLTMFAWGRCSSFTFCGKCIGFYQWRLKDRGWRFWYIM